MFATKYLLAKLNIRGVDTAAKTDEKLGEIVRNYAYDAADVAKGRKKTSRDFLKTLKFMKNVEKRLPKLEYVEGENFSKYFTQVKKQITDISKVIHLIKDLIEDEDLQLLHDVRTPFAVFEEFIRVLKWNFHDLEASKENFDKINKILLEIEKGFDDLLTLASDALNKAYAYFRSTGYKTIGTVAKEIDLATFIRDRTSNKRKLNGKTQFIRRKLKQLIKELEDLRKKQKGVESKQKVKTIMAQVRYMEKHFLGLIQFSHDRIEISKEVIINGLSLQKKYLVDLEALEKEVKGFTQLIQELKSKRTRERILASKGKLIGGSAKLNKLIAGSAREKVFFRKRGLKPGMKITGFEGVDAPDLFDPELPQHLPSRESKPSVIFRPENIKPLAGNTLNRKEVVATLKREELELAAQVEAAKVITKRIKKVEKEDRGDIKSEARSARFTRRTGTRWMRHARTWIAGALLVATVASTVKSDMSSRTLPQSQRPVATSSVAIPSPGVTPKVRVGHVGDLPRPTQTRGPNRVHREEKRRMKIKVDLSVDEILKNRKGELSPRELEQFSTKVREVLMDKKSGFKKYWMEYFPSEDTVIVFGQKKDGKKEALFVYWLRGGISTTRMSGGHEYSPTPQGTYTLTRRGFKPKSWSGHWLASRIPYGAPLRTIKKNIEYQFKGMRFVAPEQIIQANYRGKWRNLTGANTDSSLWEDNKSGDVIPQFGSYSSYILYGQEGEVLFQNRVGFHFLRFVLLEKTPGNVTYVQINENGSPVTSISGGIVWHKKDGKHPHFTSEDFYRKRANGNYKRDEKYLSNDYGRTAQKLKGTVFFHSTSVLEEQINDYPEYRNGWFPHKLLNSRDTTVGGGANSHGCVHATPGFINFIKGFGKIKLQIHSYNTKVSTTLASYDISASVVGVSHKGGYWHMTRDGGRRVLAKYFGLENGTRVVRSDHSPNNPI